MKMYYSCLPSAAICFLIIVKIALAVLLKGFCLPALLQVNNKYVECLTATIGLLI